VECVLKAQPVSVQAQVPSQARKDVHARAKLAPGAQWMTSGAANAPICVRTDAIRLLRSASLCASPSDSVTYAYMPCPLILCSTLRDKDARQRSWRVWRMTGKMA